MTTTEENKDINDRIFHQKQFLIKYHNTFEKWFLSSLYLRGGEIDM